MDRILNTYCGLTYVKNFLGADVSSSELNKVEYPFAEIMAHTTLKSFEVGMTGSMVCGLLAAVRNKYGIGFRSVLRRYTRVGIGSWLMLGPAFSFGYMYANELTPNSSDELIDRCIALRQHKAELWYDRAALGGFLVGSTIATASGGSFMVGGAFAGTCAWSYVLIQELNGGFKAKMPSPAPEEDSESGPSQAAQSAAPKPSAAQKSSPAPKTVSLASLSSSMPMPSLASMSGTTPTPSPASISSPESAPMPNLASMSSPEPAPMPNLASMSSPEPAPMPTPEQESDETPIEDDSDAHGVQPQDV